MCLKLNGGFGKHSNLTHTPSYLICKLKDIRLTKLEVFSEIVDGYQFLKEIYTQEKFTQLFDAIEDIQSDDIRRDECQSDYEYCVLLQISAIKTKADNHPALFEEIVALYYLLDEKYEKTVNYRQQLLLHDLFKSNRAINERFMTLNQLETMHCIINNCKSIDFKQEIKYFRIDRSPSKELETILKEFARELQLLCTPCRIDEDEERLVDEIKNLKIKLESKQEEMTRKNNFRRGHNFNPATAGLEIDVQQLQLQLEDKELSLKIIQEIRETKRNKILASKEVLFEEDCSPQEIAEAKEITVKTKARAGTEAEKTEISAREEYFKKALNFLKDKAIQSTIEMADLQKLPEIAYFRNLLAQIKQRRARNLTELFPTATEFQKYLNNYLFLKQYNELFPEKRRLLLDHIKILKRDKKPLKPGAAPFSKYLASLYQQKIYLWNNYEYVLTEFETIQYMQYAAQFKQALQTLACVCECKLLLSAIELDQTDLVDVRIGYLLYLLDSKQIEEPKIKFILAQMKQRENTDADLIFQLKRQVQTIEQSNFPPYTNDIGAYIQQQQLVRWLFLHIPKLRSEQSQIVLDQLSAYNKYNFLPLDNSFASETTLVNDSTKKLPLSFQKQDRIKGFYSLTKTAISLILLLNPHSNSGVDHLITISYEINNLLNGIKEDNISKSTFLKSIEVACTEMKANIKSTQYRNAKDIFNKSYFDRLFDKLKLNLSTTWNATIHSLSLVYSNYFRCPRPNSSVTICIKIIHILIEILPQSSSTTISPDVNYFIKIVDSIEVKLSNFGDILADEHRNKFESIILQAANDIITILKEFRIIFSFLNIHNFILYLNSELPFKVMVPPIFNQFYTVKMTYLNKHFKSIGKISNTVKQTLDIIQNRYFSPEVEKLLMEYRSELVVFASDLDYCTESIVFRLTYSSNKKPRIIKELGDKIELLMLKNTKLDIEGGIKNLQVLKHTIAEKELQKRTLDHEIAISRRQNIVSVFNHNLYDRKIKRKSDELKQVENKIHYLNLLTNLPPYSTDTQYTSQISQLILMINEDKSLAFGFNNFAIRYASQFGHMELVKELLKYEAVVRHMQDSQRSNNGNLHFEPIQLAIMNGHLEILSLLLKYAPPAHFTIIWAAEHQFWEAVKVLLVDKRIHSNILNNILVVLASKDGKLDIVDYLTRDDTVDPAAQENSAFIEACGGGHLNIAQFLLKFKCVVPNSQRNRAVQLAAKNGKSKIVKFLLQLEKVDPTDNNNEAIKAAVENNHANTVEILLCDPRVDPNIEGSELLHIACRKGRIRALQALINDKRTVIPFSDKGNFIIAVNHGKDKLLSFLQNINYTVDLKSYEFGIQDQFAPEDGELAINYKPHQLINTLAGDDEEFVDALEYAEPHKSYGEMLNCYSQNGRASLVELILKDDNPYLSSNGCNALIIACQNGHLPIVKSLLKDGRFDPSVDGNISLILACKNGHAEVVDLLLQDSRVDPAVNNNSPIIFAARNGHLGVVELLLKHPKVDASDNDNSAMSLARDSGHKDVVAALLKNPKVALLAAFENQDPDSVFELISAGDFAPQFKNNYTIRMACINGYVSVVEKLLGDKRVNPAANGNQALIGAIKNGHDRVVEMLLGDYRVDIKKQEGTIFKTCCEFNRIGILFKLMEDRRFNPERVVSDGLLAATMRGNLEIVDAILSKPDYLKALKAGDIFSTVFKFAKSKNEKTIMNALDKVK